MRQCSGMSPERGVRSKLDWVGRARHNRPVYRRYKVIWGDEAEVRSFEDRWKGGNRAWETRLTVGG